MAITEFDLGRIDELIETEEATLEPKHAESIAYRAIADRHVAGGVASSWQDSPPHAIFADHGLGSRLWDIDGNEYTDFHLGYGAMVVGHAHPKIVEALQKQAARGTHFAQPTKDLDVIGENLSDRFKLPLWRFANSGTETTLEAIRLMRANTGRDMVIKIEGTYHGHHDSIMFSVGPDRSEIGPREHPVTVHQAMGIPQAFADLVRVIPYNDLVEAKRAFDENPDKIAGLIIEPAMMNCGVILPEPGYLQGLKDLCHANGAYLAFDEVKTGATLAYGGATEVFGVVPDIICLAKAIGGGLPCGAIGATRELYRPVLEDEYDMAGTFNGNPLTMAAMNATLTEILVPDAYTEFSRLSEILREGCDGVIASNGLAGYTTVLGARGAVTYRAERVRNYRDYLEVSDQLAYVNWLAQFNRGVFMAPWGKSENWTLTVQHSEEDVRRYVDNFEYLGKALSA